MKALLNWRYYVLTTLFATMFLSVVLIFGEDERPLGQWILTRVCLAAFTYVCGLAFRQLSMKWKREGYMPELTNEQSTK